MWECLTYEEWQGWVEYSNHEPWGELRDDMRMSAVVANLFAFWSPSPVHDTPDLIWPYIASPEDVATAAQELLEYKRQHYGQAQHDDDSPGPGHPADADGG